MKNLWVFAFDFLSPFSKFSKVRSFKEKRERERDLEERDGGEMATVMLYFVVSCGK